MTSTETTTAVRNHFGNLVAITDDNGTRHDAHCSVQADGATIEQLELQSVDPENPWGSDVPALLAEVDRLDADLAAEREKVRLLSEALHEAASDVADYVRYAGEHLSQKWTVDADVARWRALAGRGAAEPEREGGDVPCARCGRWTLFQRSRTVENREMDVCSRCAADLGESHPIGEGAAELGEQREAPLYGRLIEVLAKPRIGHCDHCPHAVSAHAGGYCIDCHEVCPS